MRKAFVSLLLALATALSLTTTPAQASTVELGSGWTQVTPYGAAARTQYDCPSGKICAWNDPYGWGTRCEWYVSAIRGGTTFPSRCANQMSSSFNRSAYRVVWFNGAHCESSSAKREDGPNYYQGNWATRDFDNEASSLASRANWLGEYC